MRDQKAILIKCLKDDVPAFVLSGKDVNAVPALQKYLEVAKINNCNEDFIEDLEQVLKGFIRFSEEENHLMKKPTL